jgi:hypothetical protein
VKQPHALLKLAAVVSSVLLVGGFVSYRAGAFTGLMETGEQPAEPASSPDPEKNLMGGSKSKTISFEPPAAQQPPPGTGPRSPTIMSGSKSIAPVIVPLPANSQPASPVP